MKKLCILALLAVLTLALLTGCADKTGTDATPTPSPTEDLAPTPTDNANIESDPTEPAYPADDPRGLVQIAVLTVADSRVEYLVDTGLSDPAVRDYLNNQLLDFFAWPTYDAENSDKVVETTASFSIIGGRYLNVKSSDYESVPGAAYPTANVRAATFDLTTGDGVAPFGGIFTVDEAFLSAIRGALTLVEPEADIPDAADVLADALGDPAQQADVQIIDDYTFAIYLGGRLHAEGDFWKFLGDTADFAPFFTPAFADAFAGRVL